MLDSEAVATAYEKILIEVPEFTKDLLGIYVTAPLYGDCITCGPNQAFEALQVRCNGCGKGRPGLQRLNSEACTCSIYSFEYQPYWYKTIRQRLAEVIDDLRDAVEAAKVVLMTCMFLDPVLGKIPRSQLLLGFLGPSIRGEAQTSPS